MGVRHMDNRRFNKVLNQRNLYIRDSVYYFRYKQKWTTLKATTKAEAIKEKDQLLAQKKLGILTDISKDTKLVDMLKEYVKWIETSLDAGAEHKNGMAPDLIERKKDIKEQETLVELKEKQIEKYQTQISEYKEEARNSRIQAEKAKIEAEDSSPIIKEIEELKRERVKVEKEIKSTKENRREKTKENR